MSTQNIGDKLKNNVNTVLTGGGIMEDIVKYYDIDSADKRRKVSTKKADNHVMPELSNVYTNNKNEKKLLEDIAVFLNHLESKHQESNMRKRNKVLNGSKNISVNQNVDLNTPLLNNNVNGGFVAPPVANKAVGGRMYNKCRKLEDEFSLMI